MKNGKSPGIDSRQVELLKADATTSFLVLADLFAKIWNLLGIPIDRSIRLIHKIPKKGASTIVTTVARHKHLSLFQLISSKVFCRTFLKMIDSAIDPKLRPEQTRFRKGRGCMVRDFPLQNMTEQCIDWMFPCLPTSLSLRKHSTVWKILRAYGHGLPP